MGFHASLDRNKVKNSLKYLRLILPKHVQSQLLVSRSSYYSAFETSNGVIWASFEVMGVGSGEGRCCVDFRAFLDAVKANNRALLALAHEGDKLLVDNTALECSEYRYRLPTIKWHTHRRLVDGMPALLRAVVPCCNPGLLSMPQILLRNHPTAEAIAMDGHRLHWAKNDNFLWPMDRWSLPMEAAEAIITAASTDPGLPALRFDEDNKWVIVDFRNHYVTTRLSSLELQYDNYLLTFDKSCLVEKRVLSATLESYAPDKHKVDAVICQLEPGKLTIRRPGGKLTKSMPISGGEPLTFKILRRYLLDALSACNSSNVKLLFKDSESPISLRPADTDSFRAILSTMELTDAE